MSKKEMKARLAAIRKEAEQAERAGDSERLDALLVEAEEINAKLDNAEKLAKLNNLAGDYGDEGGEEGGEQESK